MDIFTAVLVLGIMGAVFGIVLAVASEKFKVPVDEKELAVLDALPGANCGACGFAGCSGLAAAVAKGEAPTNGCVIGGAETAKKVAKIMGSEALETEKKVAVALCQGNCELSKSKYNYQGIHDGINELVFYGGHKACPVSCIGCENCYRACQYGAIHMEKEIAVIDSEKCVACGACTKVCPKNVIRIVPYKNKYHVKCRNEETGKEVRTKCKIGCIGCKMCEKNCPKGAVTVENNVASIDYEKCINCGICSQKCPTHAIPMQEKDIKAVEARKAKKLAEAKAEAKAE